MKNRWLYPCLAALGALMLSGPTATATNKADNPYADTIVGRNVFSLKSPPPPPRPEDLIKKDPPPKILLQGLTTILGRRQVLFKVQLPAKPGQQAKEESFVAAEKERYGEIEVLEIDEAAGIVKFDNHGTQEALNMKDHVAKAIAAPPPALPQPGGPAPTLPGIPRPTAAGIPASPTGGAVTTIGGDTSRMPPRSLRTAGGTFGSGVPGAAGAQQQVTPQLDPEASALLYQLNKEKNKELSEAGLLPRMPDHPLFKNVGQNQNQPPPNQPQE